MTLLLANIVVIGALGFVVLRRGPDRRVGSIRSARWLRVAGLIPLGLQTAVFLFFGVGEMASGDLSGAGHLLPAAAIILLGILAWLRPLEGGIALIAGGALVMIAFIAGVVASGTAPESAAMSPAIMIVAVPQLISGVLFCIAGMLTRRSTTEGQTRTNRHHGGC